MVLRQIPFKMFGLRDIGMPDKIASCSTGRAASSSSPARPAPASRRPSRRW
jgi:hypothetical protein